MVWHFVDVFGVGQSTSLYRLGRVEIQERKLKLCRYRWKSKKKRKNGNGWSSIWRGGRRKEDRNMLAVKMFAEGVVEQIKAYLPPEYGSVICSVKSGTSRIMCCKWEFRQICRDI